jgi:hypothetical protein
VWASAYGFYPLFEAPSTKFGAEIHELLEKSFLTHLRIRREWDRDGGVPFHEEFIALVGNLLGHCLKVHLVAEFLRNNTQGHRLFVTTPTDSKRKNAKIIDDLQIARRQSVIERVTPEQAAISQLWGWPFGAVSIVTNFPAI